MIYSKIAEDFLEEYIPKNWEIVKSPSGHYYYGNLLYMKLLKKLQEKIWKRQAI